MPEYSTLVAVVDEKGHHSDKRRRDEEQEENKCLRRQQRASAISEYHCKRKNGDKQWGGTDLNDTLQAIRW